nr:unnamed protein product [Spirometra erinaceieuropaei]
MVELTHHLSKWLETAEFRHYFPQPSVIHRVEGFRQIYEGRVQVGPHLLAFLLQLAGGQNHFRGYAEKAEGGLAFQQGTLFQMVEENLSEDLPGDIQRGDTSVVVAELAVTFLLVKVNGCGYLKSWRTSS